MSPARLITLLGVCSVAGLAGGCGDDDAADAEVTGSTLGALPTEAPVTTVPAPATTEAATTTGASISTAPEVVDDPELRDELVAMFDQDQAERAGESTENGDRERQERLVEIIEEYGWPTFSMVGREGATAAWVIAQHSDLDVAFQKRALRLMRPLVKSGEADGSEFAYLQDRVLTNDGKKQRYGTQIRCGPDGGVPATPIVDAENVDERRAAVGLGPLDEYMAEIDEICASEE
jgi:hypothetical protein